MSAACQAGLVDNLNDGLAWGLFPISFAAADLGVGRIGILAAIHPAVWGLGQLYTGGLSIEAAIDAVAVLTTLSGLVVVIRMYETLPAEGRT